VAKLAVKTFLLRGEVIEFFLESQIFTQLCQLKPAQKFKTLFDVDQQRQFF
jgi:hypothetical protein